MAMKIKTCTFAPSIKLYKKLINILNKYLNVIEFYKNALEMLSASPMQSLFLFLRKEIKKIYEFILIYTNDSTQTTLQAI